MSAVSQTGASYASIARPRSYKLEDEVRKQATTDKYRFVNSVKLSLDETEKYAENVQILRAIQNVIGSELTSKIESIARVGSSLNWVIGFGEIGSQHKQQVVGKIVKIGAKKYSILDTEADSDVKATFKIHFLPVNTAIEWIENFFEQKLIKSLKIKEIEREKIDNGEFKGIINGIIKVGVSYNVSDHQEVRNLIGPQRIDGQRCTLQLLGALPKCYVCEEFGHNKSECKYLKVPCNLCERPGHLESNCKMKQVTCFFCNEIGHFKKNCKRIGEECVTCGSINHSSENCRIKNVKCTLCNKTGHTRKFCERNNEACKKCSSSRHLTENCEFLNISSNSDHPEDQEPIKAFEGNKGTSVVGADYNQEHVPEPPVVVNSTVLKPLVYYSTPKTNEAIPKSKRKDRTQENNDSNENNKIKKDRSEVTANALVEMFNPNEESDELELSEEDEEEKKPNHKLEDHLDGTGSRRQIKK